MKVADATSGRLGRSDDVREIGVDDKGYLLDPDDWSEDLATAMAQRDGVSLGPDHWQVIGLIRAYFVREGRSPPMRVLVQEAGRSLGTTADSRALYRLFPQGPAKQAARYAGLPRPASCI